MDNSTTTPSQGPAARNMRTSTDELRRVIHRLATVENLNREQIAEKIGMRLATVSRYLSAMDLGSCPTPRRAETNALNKRIGDLYAMGRTNKEIAAAVGRTAGRVTQVLTMLGLLDKNTSTTHPKSGTTTAMDFCALLLGKALTLPDIAARLAISENWATELLVMAQHRGFKVLRSRSTGLDAFRLVPIVAVPVLKAPPTLVSPAEYARLCKVDRTSIRDRIDSGTVVPEHHRTPSGRPQIFINLNHYPPTRK